MTEVRLVPPPPWRPIEQVRIGDYVHQDREKIPRRFKIPWYEDSPNESFVTGTRGRSLSDGLSRGTIYGPVSATSTSRTKISVRVPRHRSQPPDVRRIEEIPEHIWINVGFVHRSGWVDRWFTIMTRPARP